VSVTLAVKQDIEINRDGQDEQDKDERRLMKVMPLKIEPLKVR
jgi:hypothetical protein